MLSRVGMCGYFLYLCPRFELIKMHIRFSFGFTPALPKRGFFITLTEVAPGI